MTDTKPDADAVLNTDRELWRAREGDYYAPSIHVTAQGGIGINVGGHVFVMTLEQWHALAQRNVRPDADAVRDYAVNVIRREVDRALNPKGMSTHSGKVTLDISHVQRAVALLDAQAQEIAELKAENATLLFRGTEQAERIRAERDALANERDYLNAMHHAAASFLNAHGWEWDSLIAIYREAHGDDGIPPSWIERLDRASTSDDTKEGRT